MGRKLSTGNCATREELLEKVHGLYYETRLKPAQIARFCRISDTLVHQLLKQPRPVPGKSD